MIKKLAKFIGEYKKETILSPVFISMEVVLECLIPLVMSKIIDQIYGGSLTSIILIAIALIAMAGLSLVCGALSGSYCATASCGYARNVRRALFQKVQGFSFSNIDKFSSSSLVTRLTTDVTNVQMAFMMIIRVAVRAPFMLIFSLVMSMTISIKMALIFLIIVPILGCGLFALIKLVFPLFNKVFKKYDALNSSVQENIKGMRVVKTYVREEYEKEKFEKAAEEVRRDFTKAEKILAFNSPMINFCVFLVILLISVLGAYLIINTFGGITEEGEYLWGELSTGQLASLITYATQVMMSLMMVSMIFVMLSLSQASAKRIVEVLDEQSDIVSPENAITEVKNGDVDFDNVSFKYSKDAERNALENVNLHIKSGETVGVIGGTGSSKTTLIQLISRLYDVCEGSVKVGGVDVREYDLDALRNAVAVVLQKNTLFSGTIRDNLRWGNAEATDEEIISACKIAQAHDFVMSFENGYDTYIEQGGSNVSGGQKQRLCIARALLKKPKIIILDDSTSAVDTKTDALIRKGFKENLPDITAIIIAQRISSVKDADKIIVMDGGKIVAEGKHDELLETCGIYREVYDIQNKLGGAK
ncbi:MAG: ABC transporter ATP-binding protein [Christensenellales bacterium]